MKNLKSKKDILRNQEGILTLDFIFSIMAMYAISMVFALLAVTLMFSTVSQYVAFSMSRAHISGHISIDDQQLAMEEQRKKIMSSPIFKKLLKPTKGSWFQLETQGFAREHFGLENSSYKAYGVKLKFTSHLLKNFRLPLLGSPSDGATGDFGEANIYSFLYREPTVEECLNFNKARWTVLKERFPYIKNMPGFVDQDYGAEADNGC